MNLTSLQRARISAHLFGLRTRAENRKIIDSQRLFTQARDAGLPNDSLSRFQRAGYTPWPKQIQFHAAARLCDLPDGPTEIGVGGARGGAKSHAVLAQIALDDCQRVPGLKFLLLRQTGKYAQESFDDLYTRVVQRSPYPHKYVR